jgi:hypothetical protein
MGGAKGGNVMTEVRISDRYLAQLYREAYARHQQSVQLGLRQLADTRTFPSTDPTSTEGERGPVSPLGGRTW